MQKLILGIAVALFVCVGNANSHEGYCERGLYIPTHIIECVAFCADHGKVSTISSFGVLGDIHRCECTDGNIKRILSDPQRLQCPKIQSSEYHG